MQYQSGHPGIDSGQTTILYVDVDDFPALLTLNEDTAFVVGAVGETAVFGSAGEHEGAADDGRVAIERKPKTVGKD